ncbi:hypothetical protein ColTof4_05626 [Colletotrichum tofieldiae]|nr:hypothetical protein ColTof4_05626 [Colletotrichum tofieldiae]
MFEESRPSPLTLTRGANITRGVGLASRFLDAHDQQQYEGRCVTSVEKGVQPEEEPPIAFDRMKC